MTEQKTVAAWMAERGLRVEELVAASALDRRVVEAISLGRYTPSPQQRQRLADALRVSPEQVLWGHFTPIDNMYGHGPQFGRSP